MRGLVPTLVLLVAAAFAMAQDEDVARAAVVPQTQSENPLAATARDVLAQAEHAFQAGEYERAAELYQSLLEQAPRDPRLLYNLGTAHARAGETGLAVWRYMQALQLDPRDPELRANLRILAPNLKDDLAIAPVPPLNWAYWKLTGNEWTKLAALFTVVALLLGAAAFLRPRMTRGRYALRLVGWGAAVAALLLWAPALLHYQREELSSEAVVVARETWARTGPSENEIETFGPLDHRIVQVIDLTHEGWVKIGLGGGRVGYVQRDAIRFI